MASTTLAEGRTFIKAGKNITSLYRITEGSVSAFRQGGEIILHEGDIIGICELSSPVHLFSYKTVDKTTVESYSFSGPEDLLSVFQQDSEFAECCLSSSFAQTQALFEQYFSALDEASVMYQSCTEDEDEYLSFCRKYRIAPCRLPAMDTLTPFPEDASVDEGILEYLKGFGRIVNGDSRSFLNEPEVLSGLLRRNAKEASQAVSLLDKVSDYLCPLYRLYAADDQPDLLGLYSSLLFEIGIHTEDSPSIQKILAKIILQLKNSSYSNPETVHRKVTQYQKLSAASMKKAAGSDEYLDLADSLSIILNFSTLEPDYQAVLRTKLADYGNVKDRSGTEEDVSLLRKEITALFLKLYENIVLRSLECEELPPAVLMFLHFGYLDETLAGEDYTRLLYDYSKQLSQLNANGIYTLYRWLKAIYNGEKEPSRNSFDEDYTDSLHKQKMNGKITEEQEKQLLRDRKQKLLFELHNMFPNVNKMTYGKISTYCPVFSDHNIFKPLDAAFVTPDAVYKILALTTNADFHAFFRETIYTNEDCGIAKEYVHTECLPDIILMPCVGTRGVMWQEIEGKKRATPSRMMLPVFQMEDLTSCMLHIIGEYRWEICKRIQGARWNDVTDRSLTSEYFDYLQFYKKNADLTSDMKEKIKNNIQKCKNSFKEMFVRDYMLWVLYESAGSPRLNKTARGILFSYCPFSASIRNDLLTNPLYKEGIDRYNLKVRQKLHRLDNLFTKISNSGRAIPEELEKEYEFWNR